MASFVYRPRYEQFCSETDGIGPGHPVFARLERGRGSCGRLRCRAEGRKRPPWARKHPSSHPIGGNVAIHPGCVRRYSVWDRTALRGRNPRHHRCERAGATVSSSGRSDLEHSRASPSSREGRGDGLRHRPAVRDRSPVAGLREQHSSTLPDPGGADPSDTGAFDCSSSACGFRHPICACCEIGDRAGAATQANPSVREADATAASRTTRGSSISTCRCRDAGRLGETGGTRVLSSKTSNPNGESNAPRSATARGTSFPMAGAGAGDLELWSA